MKKSIAYEYLNVTEISPVKELNGENDTVPYTQNRNALT